jgi:hypothetical protein
MSDQKHPAARKSDLRKSRRFSIDDATTLVYRKGLLQSLGIGRTNEARAAVNISEGGILIRSHDKVTNGTKVRVRLEIEKFKDVIEAEGEVCWCVQGTGGDDYYAGIRFTDLPSAAATKISRLRGYFTSPEYRSRTAFRRHQAALGFAD